LAGNYIKDSGNIFVDGQKFEIRGPAEAVASGIRVIYQELNTINNLTVAENIFIGEQIVKGPFKIVDWKTMLKRSLELLDILNVKLNPNAILGDLSVSEKQIVEIAKAISKEAKILVMDEPTAALSEEETQSLFKIIRTLKSKGVSIIYISHRLKEIFEITDRVTVLRDGKKVGTLKTSDTDENKRVEMMVGRIMAARASPPDRIDHPILRKITKKTNPNSPKMMEGTPARQLMPCRSLLRTRMCRETSMSTSSAS
jgi:ribose transport system ATP-binding protein